MTENFAIAPLPEGSSGGDHPQPWTTWGISARSGNGVHSQKIVTAFVLLSCDGAKIAILYD
jgi:hypothetical protein